MITLIEARNYKCLRDVTQRLGPYHVLVGPNASGKSTFLGIPALLGLLVAVGLGSAIRSQTLASEEEARPDRTFRDLLWMRAAGLAFEERHLGFAVEAL